MKIIKLSETPVKEAVKKAKEFLANDSLVVLPSDTAYGLAAKATSDRAVQRVFAFKGRRFGKGVSVFLDSAEAIQRYAVISHEQEALVDSILPGPFTIILASRHVLSRELEPADGTLGVRVVDYPFINRLLAEISFPITATSANLAGRGPHYSARAFLATLSARKKSMIDLVIDAGPLPPRQTSTVVRLVGDQVEVLRRGVLNFRLLGSWFSASEENTRQIAVEIFRKYFLPELNKSGVAAVLKGPLGAGKTIFAKGIGELFGMQLTSPTFTLMDEYVINIKNQKLNLKNIYHLDLYRIEEQQEITDLELEKLINPGNLILVEWGEKLAAFEPLKQADAAFFWLQIEEFGKDKRKLSLYRL